MSILATLTTHGCRAMITPPIDMPIPIAKNVSTKLPLTSYIKPAKHENKTINRILHPWLLANCIAQYENARLVYLENLPNKGGYAKLRMPWDILIKPHDEATLFLPNWSMSITLMLAKYPALPTEKIVTAHREVHNLLQNGIKHIPTPPTAKLIFG